MVDEFWRIWKARSLDLCPAVSLLLWPSWVLNTTNRKQTEICTAWVCTYTASITSHSVISHAFAITCISSAGPGCNTDRGGGCVCVWAAGSWEYRVSLPGPCVRPPRTEIHLLSVTEVPPLREAAGLSWSYPPNRKQYTAHMLCFCFPWFCSHFCYSGLVSKHSLLKYNVTSNTSFTNTPNNPSH